MDPDIYRLANKIVDSFSNENIYVLELPLIAHQLYGKRDLEIIINTIRKSYPDAYFETNPTPIIKTEDIRYFTENESCCGVEFIYVTEKVNRSYLITNFYKA